MIIFIAVPSAGVVKNGKLRFKFLKRVAELQLAHPDKTFVAPMIQDYALLKYMPNVEATWEKWGHHCRNLIEVCDQVWVITYTGWVYSTGVNAEIECAASNNKPTYFLEP
jgi:hypothetical protein